MQTNLPSNHTIAPILLTQWPGPGPLKGLTADRRADTREAMCEEKTLLRTGGSRRSQGPFVYRRPQRAAG